MESLVAEWCCSASAQCGCGAAVRAELDGIACSVLCVDGRFTVTLPPQQASCGHTIILCCEDERIVLEDVCFGDVFLLSGQSNMQLPVSRVQDVSEAETLAADYPLIRHFVVEPRYFFGREADEIISGAWIKGVYPEVMSMSAAGFFFARRLYEEKQIPVGLVLNAMGGSCIEAWMSEVLLNSMGISTERILAFRTPGVFEEKICGEENRFADWMGSLLTGHEEEDAAAMPGYICSGLGITGGEEDLDIRLQWGYAGGNFWYGHRQSLRDDNLSPAIQDFLGRTAASREVKPLDPVVVTDEDQNEMLNLWQTSIVDTVNTWTLNFVTGQKDINADWDTYVAELEAANLQSFLDMYNAAYNAGK